MQRSGDPGVRRLLVAEVVEHAARVEFSYLMQVLVERCILTTRVLFGDGGTAHPGSLLTVIV